MDPYRSQISGEDAAKLLRPTSQISKDPDLHIMALDVYHQLHCLNDLRETFAKLATSDQKKLNHLEEMHKFHCIDSIRQSLMCNADISLVHWYWKEESQKHFPSAVTTHVCRKWSKIEEWAISHRLNDSLWDPRKLIEEH
ncbi:hypothetical protein BKA67DRAFT_582944 [Truncatella angustata]|uniref:Uncharacterized protein n=1 Tax=Truncatella angustata TaxID=152316 RepID=A0A9P8RMS3_9PEZI|nr:uncharacterized protein BKA67DRAFT_582944 [Truncatella angustata]KAH6646001.1 hypothetical protein BKA67DRAFT_582944 [Truncatella angustata]